MLGIELSSGQFWIIFKVQQGAFCFKMHLENSDFYLSSTWKSTAGDKFISFPLGFPLSLYYLVTYWSTRTVASCSLLHINGWVLIVFFFYLISFFKTHFWGPSLAILILWFQGEAWALAFFIFEIPQWSQCAAKGESHLSGMEFWPKQDFSAHCWVTDNPWITWGCRWNLNCKAECRFWVRNQLWTWFKGQSSLPSLRRLAAWGWGIELANET